MEPSNTKMPVGVRPSAYSPPSLPWRYNKHLQFSQKHTFAMQWHTKKKTHTHLNKVHIYSVKLQPLAFVEEGDLCLRRALSPDDTKQDTCWVLTRKTSPPVTLWSSLVGKRKLPVTIAWPVLVIGVSSEGNTEWETFWLHLWLSLSLSIVCVRCELCVSLSLCGSVGSVKHSICVRNLIRDGSNQTAVGLNTAWNQSRPSRD